MNRSPDSWREVVRIIGWSKCDARALIWPTLVCVEYRSRDAETEESGNPGFQNRPRVIGSAGASSNKTGIPALSAGSPDGVEPTSYRGAMARTTARSGGIKLSKMPTPKDLKKPSAAFARAKASTVPRVIRRLPKAVMKRSPTNPPGLNWWHAAVGGTGVGAVITSVLTGPALEVHDFHLTMGGVVVIGAVAVVLRAVWR